VFDDVFKVVFGDIFFGGGFHADHTGCVVDLEDVLAFVWSKEDIDTADG